MAASSRTGAVFTVTAPPTVTVAASPASLPQGASNQDITLTGTGFQGVASTPYTGTVAFSGTGITVNSVTFNSATSLTVNLSIDPAATISNRTVTVTNFDGGVGTRANTFAVTAGPPVVTNVTSSTPNGLYNSGTISIQVTFSAAVTVASGTPTLALNSGGTAFYATGSGTTTLNFNYTIAPGNNSNHLDYTSTSALSAGGGTIRNGATDAVLTLPAPGAAGSLGFNTNFAIVTTGPTVTNVTAQEADGTYGVGQLIHVFIQFSTQVIIDNSGNPGHFPQLSLATGTPPATLVDCTNPSSTDTLTCDYTVIAGNSSADLNYSSTAALTLPAGVTLKDASSNVASLTLPGLAAAGSLGTNKNIVIDGVPPTVTNFTCSPAGPNLSVTTLHCSVTFSEPVNGFDSSQDCSGSRSAGPRTTWTAGLADPGPLVD